MGRVLSATEARVHFGALLRRVVEQDETVVVERGGKPQVVVMSMPAYERLQSCRQTAANGGTALAHVHAMVRADLNGRQIDVDTLFAEMREEQDDHLLADLHRR